MCNKKLFYNARACTAIQCNDLNTPTFENGRIMYAEDNAAPFDLDTLATYECHDGFFLNGEAERHCTVGEGRSSGIGTWDGIAPTCDRKLSQYVWYGNCFLMPVHVQLSNVTT